MTRNSMLPVNSAPLQICGFSAECHAVVKQSAAVCNYNSLNLVLVSKCKVVGKVADLAASKACEACFLVRLHSMQHRPVMT